MKKGRDIEKRPVNDVPKCRVWLRIFAPIYFPHPHFREQGDKYSNTSMTIIHYLRLFRPDVALIAFFSYLVEAELALEGEMMSMA